MLSRFPKGILASFNHDIFREVYADAEFVRTHGFATQSLCAARASGTGLQPWIFFDVVCMLGERGVGDENVGESGDEDVRAYPSDEPPRERRCPAQKKNGLLKMMFFCLVNGYSSTTTPQLVP